MKKMQDQFDELYDAYYLEIKKFIYTIARRDENIAEDIFQNTWENAFRYIHTLKNIDSARAWLYTIARNETKRWFSQRSNKMFTTMISTDENELPEIQDEAESEFPEFLANSDMLANALNSLSHEEQQIILLNYYYDISLKDIATMYGTKYNTLKSIARRALVKMRKAGEYSEED